MFKRNITRGIDIYQGENVMRRDHESSARRLFAGLTLFISLLAFGCTSVTQPLEITSISIEPEPAVGRIVTIQVELSAYQDLDEGLLEVYDLSEIGNQVEVVGSQDSWVFNGVKADEPVTASFDICVKQVGIWPLEMAAIAVFSDGSRPEDYRIFHLESLTDGGRLMPPASTIGNWFERMEESRSDPDTVYDCN